MRFFTISNRFRKKTACCTNNQICMAAPHFKMCFGHGWAHVNTEAVQTLSLLRFVASGNSANLDCGRDFVNFKENCQIFNNFESILRNTCVLTKQSDPHSSAAFLDVFWAWVGQCQHKVCANLEFLTCCGLAKQCKPRWLAWI